MVVWKRPSYFFLLLIVAVGWASHAQRTDAFLDDIVVDGASATVKNYVGIFKQVNQEISVVSEKVVSPELASAQKDCAHVIAQAEKHLRNSEKRSYSRNDWNRILLSMQTSAGALSGGIDKVYQQQKKLTEGRTDETRLLAHAVFELKGLEKEIAVLLR